MSITYSRSYEKVEDEVIKIPDGYDGNAFRQESEPVSHITQPQNPPPEETEPAGAFGDSRSDGLFSLFDKFPIGKIFSGLGGGVLPKFKMPEIHGEEILIIALAAFLFFSKGGDKESAIMLLLLLLF
ncbi:MAG: hypothetical protein IJY65_03935 [Clostridia bacterium]|nr:hypothetical protein [Clostridia bacterium]